MEAGHVWEHPVLGSLQVLRFEESDDGLHATVTVSNLEDARIEDPKMGAPYTMMKDVDDIFPKWEMTIHMADLYLPSFVRREILGDFG